MCQDDAGANNRPNDFMIMKSGWFATQNRPLYHCTYHLFIVRFDHMAHLLPYNGSRCQHQNCMLKDVATKLTVMIALHLRTSADPIFFIRKHIEKSS